MYIKVYYIILFYNKFYPYDSVMVQFLQIVLCELIQGILRLKNRNSNQKDNEFLLFYYFYIILKSYLY